MTPILNQTTSLADRATGKPSGNRRRIAENTLCLSTPKHTIRRYTPLSSITLRNEGIGFGCPDDGRFDTPHTTPYLHGAL
jgi:hypothetical protein